MKLALTVLSFVALFIFAWLGTGVAQTDHSITERAYQQLLASPTFPKDRTPSDVEAIESIHRDPAGIESLLVTHLSQGPEEHSAYQKTLAVFHILPNLPLKLQIAREVIQGMRVGERAPLIYFLAANAGPQDMQLLIAEIEADPNGQGVGIAVAIAQSRNSEALKQLRVMRDKVPGVWGYYLEPEELEHPRDRPDKKDGGEDDGIKEKQD